MLDARNLTLWRGENCLFEDLSFRVPEGSALVLRGPNGAGKTTLLRVLCGLSSVESGEISWNGRTGGDCLQGAVAYCGHLPALKADLTVAQNLDFYARLPGASPDWRPLVEAFGLGRCRELEVRRLSAGQKRRAGLARVLLTEATVWLLDEPYTNLDAAGRGLIEDRMAAHLRAGGIAVVAAHDDIRLGAPAATLALGAH
jgi:heme exporter protein A